MNTNPRMIHSEYHPHIEAMARARNIVPRVGILTDIGLSAQRPCGLNFVRA
jgi:hypothetical protein